MFSQPIKKKKKKNCGFFYRRVYARFGGLHEGVELLVGGDRGALIHNITFNLFVKDRILVNSLFLLKETQKIFNIQPLDVKYIYMSPAEWIRQAKWIEIVNIQFFKTL